MTTNTKQNIPDSPSRHIVSVLPWTADGDQVISDDIWIADCSVSCATSPKTDWLNAQFIVTACNSYAALLAVAEIAKLIAREGTNTAFQAELERSIKAMETLNSLPTPK